jgi:L,D-transpeptidase ErfK/SrfK
MMPGSEPPAPRPSARGFGTGAERPSSPAVLGGAEGSLGDPVRRRWGLGARAAAASAGVGLLLLTGTGFHYRPVRPEAPPEAILEAARSLGDAEATRLRSDHRRLTRELERLVPRRHYLVIDQTHNRIRLRRGRETVLEAPCSAGSGVVLRESAGNRIWVFDTPRGVFSVISKIRNPIWKKPDWAFVEEGEPIPRDPADRLEYGVLGEHALYFGDGYLIHGTLYERFIGRPVSHGCIRVGREPLREIYRVVPVGAPIYIY